MGFGLILRVFLQALLVCYAIGLLPCTVSHENWSARVTNNIPSCISEAKNLTAVPKLDHWKKIYDCVQEKVRSQASSGELKNDKQQVSELDVQKAAGGLLSTVSDQYGASEQKHVVHPIVQGWSRVPTDIQRRSYAKAFDDQDNKGSVPMHVSFRSPFLTPSELKGLDSFFQRKRLLSNYLKCFHGSFVRCIRSIPDRAKSSLVEVVPAGSPAMTPKAPLAPVGSVSLGHPPKVAPVSHSGPSQQLPPLSPPALPMRVPNKASSLTAVAVAVPVTAVSTLVIVGLALLLYRKCQKLKLSKEIEKQKNEDKAKEDRPLLCPWYWPDEISPQKHKQVGPEDLVKSQVSSVQVANNKTFTVTHQIISEESAGGYDKALEDIGWHFGDCLWEGPLYNDMMHHTMLDNSSSFSQSASFSLPESFSYSKHPSFNPSDASEAPKQLVPSLHNLKPATSFILPPQSNEIRASPRAPTTTSTLLPHLAPIGFRLPVPELSASPPQLPLPLPPPPCHGLLNHHSVLHDSMLEAASPAPSSASVSLAPPLHPTAPIPPAPPPPPLLRGSRRPSAPPPPPPPPSVSGGPLRPPRPPLPPPVPGRGQNSLSKMPLPPLMPPNPAGLGKKKDHSSASSQRMGEDEQKNKTSFPKLKPFFWDKVKASNTNHSMVWDELESGSFRVDEDKMNTLFGFAPPATPIKHVKLQTSTAAKGPKILDSKRAQNIAIQLRPLAMTKDEIHDALLEGEGLSTEVLEGLLKMAPTQDEERKLKDYSGDVIELDPAERFLITVLEVPFAFQRCRDMLFRASFAEEFLQIEDPLKLMKAACIELKGSKSFRKMLEAVLKTGNRMNMGTFRGDAQGFKLDTLLKLADVRSVDGKFTLLHFVIQEVLRNESSRATHKGSLESLSENLMDASAGSSGRREIQMNNIDSDPLQRKDDFVGLGSQMVLGMNMELVNVKRAADLDITGMKSGVLKLASGLQRVKDVVIIEHEDRRASKSRSRIGASFSDSYQGSMLSFVNMAEADISRIQGELNEVLEMVKRLNSYFDNEAAKDEANLCRVFQIVKDFLAMLEKAYKEVAKLKDNGSQNH